MHSACDPAYFPRNIPPSSVVSFTDGYLKLVRMNLGPMEDTYEYLFLCGNSRHCDRIDDQPVLHT
jgi:hypothetical protein